MKLMGEKSSKVWAVVYQGRVVAIWYHKIMATTDAKNFKGSVVRRATREVNIQLDSRRPVVKS